MKDIISCAGARWSIGIGDPNLAGWVTVMAYALASVLAFRAAAIRDRITLAERTFWVLAGLGLAFLAVNKQLDLQSLLTDAGRCAARLQGWYGMRRAVQLDFILAMVGAGVLGGLTALWILRGTLRRTGVALLGLVWITSFVLVRAAGFHHVDSLIGLRVAGMRLNWVFELGGIAVFIFGVALAVASGRRHGAGR